ncbi:hypothetical protein GJ744_000921 [Endocarpon pusillum]|uniref:Uncharacterized protein n=1 Tax=Endocarpon pusillum TaxID=364733 RepID=A0A8H7AX17_9EURO|nr:hypothetical protein GJ744_000921 [Endocarpon pusillum]
MHKCPSSGMQAAFTRHIRKGASPCQRAQDAFFLALKPQNWQLWKGSAVRSKKRLYTFLPRGQPNRGSTPQLTNSFGFGFGEAQALLDVGEIIRGRLEDLYLDAAKHLFGVRFWAPPLWTKVNIDTLARKKFSSSLQRRSDTTSYTSEAHY